ncbi:MAG: hypothetical protein AAB531_04610 [Patescibacteria group bacterium]|mgnify:CR=1 FL=1
MNRLSLSIGGKTIDAPSQIPQGGTDTGQRIIQTGITLLFIFAIILALIYLIQGGIQWMTSGGDKQQLDQARLRITYAIIGLIIVLGGFFIVNFVFNFFNLSFT